MRRGDRTPRQRPRPTQTMTKPIPFKLDPTLATNLCVQMADGLRSAIVSGYYRRGEMLPTIVELAKHLGTSVQVPRTAIATLAAEDLVSPRRGVGCIVAGHGKSIWKGRILGIVPADREGTYHTSAFFGEMRRSFTAAGYLFDVATLDRLPNGSLQYGALDMALRLNLDFAFPLFCPAAVLKRLERAGIPFATKDGDYGVETPGPMLGDISPFLSQSRACGVDRILVVGIGSKSVVFAEVCKRFANAGLAVETILAHCSHGPGYLERLERTGMEVMIRRFSRPRESWPQLVFWADDFLATGGLIGLSERGISIPRDVYAATVANKGFAPVYPRSLARFEFDPSATGRAAAEGVIARLAGRPASPIVEVVSYIPGASLPAPDPA